MTYTDKQIAEVKRYHLSNDGKELTIDKEGGFVHYADYFRLLSKMEKMEEYTVHKPNCDLRTRKILRSDIKCTCGLEALTNKDGK